MPDNYIMDAIRAALGVATASAQQPSGQQAMASLAKPPLGPQQGPQLPQQNLGTIPIQGQQQAQQPQGGGIDWGGLIKQMAIPLTTTAIGMGVPGALPGAAGFQTGYTEERSKERDYKRLKADAMEELEKEKEKDDKRTRVTAMQMAQRALHKEYGKPASGTEIGALAEEFYKEIKGIKADKEIVSDVRKKYGVSEGKTKEEKSPYKEYPDAFKEDGVWKVKKDGKIYRIEE